MATKLTSEKAVCRISRKHVPITPEELVRQRVASVLIDNLGYAADDLAVEFPVQIGSKKHKCDIVAFKPNAAHVNEDVHMIVECKREDVPKSAMEQAKSQLISYMQACLNVRVGVVACAGTLRVLRKIRHHNGDYELREISAIPTANELHAMAPADATGEAATQVAARPPSRSHTPTVRSRRSYLALIGGAVLVVLLLVVGWQSGVARRGTSAVSGPVPAARPRSGEAVASRPLTTELAAFVGAWSAALHAPSTSLDPYYANVPRFRDSNPITSAGVRTYWNRLFGGGGVFSVDVGRSEFLTEANDPAASWALACAAVQNANGAVLKLRLQASELAPQRDLSVGCARLRGVYLLRLRRVADGFRICHESWSMLEGICASCPTVPECSRP